MWCTALQVAEPHIGADATPMWSHLVALAVLPFPPPRLATTDATISGACADKPNEKCKKNNCENYKPKKEKNCQKTRGLCEGLPPSAPLTRQTDWFQKKVVLNMAKNSIP